MDTATGARLDRLLHVVALPDAKDSKHDPQSWTFE
jgi:hypothetical protein